MTHRNVKDAAYKWHLSRQRARDAGGALNEDKKKKALRSLHQAVVDIQDCLIALDLELSQEVLEQEKVMKEHADSLRKMYLGGSDG